MPLLHIPVDALSHQLLLRRTAPDDFSAVVEAGEEADRDAVNAAFRQAFDRLLYWASMRKDGELPWPAGSTRVTA